MTATPTSHELDAMLGTALNHLRLVETILRDVGSNPHARVAWMLDNLPKTASLLGVEQSDSAPVSKPCEGCGTEMPAYARRRFCSPLCRRRARLTHQAKD